ncbi:acyltransferase family protein [Xanthomonas sp. NCPPB 2632]|uniref:acyltransferase family protein n=1 Tax=Xanthomonas sp. NCPPB 2632 TaxID=3240912 RepID=UPI00351695ED
MKTACFAEKLLPNPGKNVPYLDAIRGVAVVFIFVRHCWGIAGSPNYSLFEHSISPFLTMMSSGVDLFFVLSGVLLSARFLKADSLGRPAPDFVEYIKSRVLRIGPPYWIVLAVVLVLYTPSMIPNDRIWSSYGAFMVLAHALFAQSLFIVSFGAYMVAAPFWTLTVEMIFYLILPAMAKCFYSFRWWQGVVISFLTAIAWLYACRYYLSDLNILIRSHSFGLAYSEPGVRFFLSHQIVGYLPHFAIGCSISAILQRRSGSWFSGRVAGVVYLVSGLILLFCAMGVLGRLSIMEGFTNPELLLASSSPAALVYYFGESMPFAVAYGLIILGVSLAPRRVQNWISRPTLSLFGVLGYSIYLIHMPLLYTLNQHAIVAGASTQSVHFLRLLAIGFIVIVAASFALFQAIERPSMIWAASVRKKGLPPRHLSSDEHA